jgi:stage II sporulation protein GA (sporulation sigma-E factor processing peptidase)
MMRRETLGRGGGAGTVRVIYIDVLFTVNLIIDYFLLRASAAVLHRQENRLRLLGGAAIGALYAVLVFFPGMTFLYTAALKFASSLVITAAAFRWKGLKSYFLLTAVFYALSFLLGGAVLAVYMFASPPGLDVRNGSVYLDISPVLLIVSAAAFYIVITLASRLTGRAGRTQELYAVKIAVGGRSAKLHALLDTGNMLSDAVSGMPVIVAEYPAVKGLIPTEVRRVFAHGAALDVSAVSGSEWAGRFRMIPYGSLGDKGGLLPAFRADSVSVAPPSGGRENNLPGAVVAVCARKLSQTGGYDALIGPAVTDAAGLGPGAHYIWSRKQNPLKTKSGDDLVETRR